MATQNNTAVTETQDDGHLQRSIDWRGAFWVASGVPALVLFSIGGVASQVGKVSFAIWIVSIMMGFVQSFTYTEIAGLFPNKSGGASIYGAAAWVKYSKIIAPLSVWCNWFAWSPVLSLGSSIAAGYIIVAFGIENATLFSTRLGPVGFSINVAFFIGAALMFLCYLIQKRGILETASVQKWMGLAVIVPLAIVSVVPILTGQVSWDNFAPFVPLATAGDPTPGAWNIAGWTLVLGSMFLAGWSTYGFETAVCYTSEFRNPEKDTFKAIFYSGLLCMALFILVPFTFQGVLGLDGILAPPIADGSGVAAALAGMVGGGQIVFAILVFLMILALLLSIMTAMSGSSRTLYQGSIDGWLPKYLGHANKAGAPTSAIWTNLVFNLIVLSMASADATSFYFLLAVSNCGYIIFTFLNLNSGWIHRIDAASVPRPYKAPSWLLAMGAVSGFLNIFFMGAGAKIWNPAALWAGLGTAALIIPVFCYRHYVQDGGKFPHEMEEDLHVGSPQDHAKPRAGMLPYLALLAGLTIMLVANFVFTTN